MMDNSFENAAKPPVSVPEANIIVDGEDSPPHDFQNVDFEQDENGAQHSLPNVEEVKTDHGRGSSKECHPFVFLLCLLLLSGVIIGLSVGLTKGNRQHSSSSNENVPSQSSIQRKANVQQWLLQNGISAPQALNSTNSPQSKALTWISESDLLQLSVPAAGPDTTEGYSFLTRYVMAVLYYATNGANWNFGLLFLSQHNTCDWFFIFSPPVGQVGVLCNQATDTIAGISFSKLLS